MVDGKESESESSELNAEQQEHPLSKMPPFEEFIKQSEALSTQSGVYSDSLPKTPAIESVLHEDENDRLKKRGSLYTAYDLSKSKSKSIPDEYKGLSFEEVKQIEEEKKLATKRSEQGIFRLEEASGTSQAESETKKKKTKK